MLRKIRDKQNTLKKCLLFQVIHQKYMSGMLNILLKENNRDKKIILTNFEVIKLLHSGSIKFSTFLGRGTCLLKEKIVCFPGFFQGKN